MTEKIEIEWSHSELYYLDLSLLREDYEEEIFVFHDGECWIVLEAFFTGEREAHYADENGVAFTDIEAAHSFAERLVERYEAEAAKTDTE